ncbi:MAG: hypothetical protein H0U56_04655 [Methylibium sp.]|nr:hypothetical protein [Methylibium sp.]
MTSVDRIRRAAPLGNRAFAREPLVPGLALEALQAALRGNAGREFRPHDRRASGDNVALDKGSRDAAPAGSDPFSPYSLPPDPTPAQIAKLAADIRAATKTGGQASDKNPSLLDVASLTPL